MSFILDALRKSEHERQRQADPAIADFRAATPRPSFPIWAVGIAVLLAVNLSVLLALVIRGESRKPEPNPAPPVSASTSIAPTPGPVDLVAEPTLPSDPPPRLDAGAPSKVEQSLAPPRPLAAEPRLQAPAYDPPQPVAEAERDATLPTIHDLNLQGADALPELRLDIHVYAKRPADRFVFINMRKYKEGEQTSEGMTVERITTDGVVLDRRGTRFLLPRQ